MYFGGERDPVLSSFLALKYPKLCQDLTKKVPITCQCIPDEKNLKKRNFIFNEEILLSEVKLVKKPFFVISLEILNPSCRGALVNSRHNYCLFVNRKTQEFYVLDHRLYYLKNFAPDIIFKKFALDIMYPLLIQIFPKLVLHPYAYTTVPAKFFDQNIPHKLQHSKWTLMFIDFSMKHPTYKIKTLYTKIVNTNMIAWDDFEKYLKLKDKPCAKIDKIRNPETGKCVKKNSKNGMNVLETLQECLNGKIRNPLTNRCTKKVKDVDIVSRYGPKQKGHGGSTIVAENAIEFYLKEFPYACSDSKFVMRWNANIKELTFSHSNWMEKIEKCLNSRFSFFRLRLKVDLGTKFGYHSNVLFYDSKLNEIERFDPLGTEARSAYKSSELDDTLQEIFENIGGIKYIRPENYCPLDVFQGAEVEEIAGDIKEEGHCAIWSLWYIHLRLSNPKLNRKQLVLYSNKKLKTEYSLRKFIINYKYFIMQK